RPRDRGPRGRPRPRADADGRRAPGHRAGPDRAAAARTVRRASGGGADRRRPEPDGVLVERRREEAGPPTQKALQVIPVEGIAEVKPGDDLAALILAAAVPAPGAVVVVTQKMVSRAEG